MAPPSFRRRAWRGVLLSALVIPGLGQLSHGDRYRGLAILSAAIGCLGILFVRIFHSVWSLVQIHGYPSLSPRYVHMITESVHSHDGPFLTRMMLLFLGIWAVGVIDAWYRAPATKDPGRESLT